MEYGYARCSTNSNKQDIDRQKRELMLIGIKKENIFWEYGTGERNDREKLQQLLETVKQGDTIACTEVSRLSRSAKQLCEILEFVEKNKIKLIVGTFVVDCRNDDIDPMTMGMLRMMAVFAQMERDITIQRIKLGMINAKAKGVKLGRPQITIETLPYNFLKYYPMFQNGSINLSELSRLSGISRPTIYKYLKLLEGG